MPGPDPLDRRALVYLRGRGEGGWVSHHAPDARLRSTPAGLELALRDGWHESARQGRRGVLLLGESEGALVDAFVAASSPARATLRLSAESWSRCDGTLADWISVARAGSEGALLVGDAGELPADAIRCLARDAGALAGRSILVTGTFAHDEPATVLAPLLLELQLCPAPLARTRTGGTAGAAGELVALPAGTFRMGSPPDEPGRWGDEGPRREVKVAAFRLGRLPVTNAEFQRFLDACPDEPPPAYWADARFNADAQPVVGVGFEQAERFARWSGARLPSEAEWEYACRAGTDAARYGALDEVAWHMGNSADRLHEVGQRAPNAFGLHDLLGNAWEWVADERHDDYSGAPADARAWIDGASSPPRRLLRGGSWADSARTVRAATRLTDHPGPRVGNVGLRLAADA